MATFFSHEAIGTVGTEQLAQLKQAALQAPLRRSRLCLHHDPQDLLHEMVIVFCRASYVRPHRHKGKSESFHVIEGELEVVFFDDDGGVLRRLKMGPGPDRIFLYRLSSPIWHTVVPLSEFVILHETTTGPFTSDQAEYAAWSPAADDATGVAEFLAGLHGEGAGTGC